MPSCLRCAPPFAGLVLPPRLPFCDVATSLLLVGHCSRCFSFFVASCPSLALPPRVALPCLPASGSSFALPLRAFQGSREQRQPAAKRPVEVSRFATQQIRMSSMLVCISRNACVGLHSALPLWRRLVVMILSKASLQLPCPHRACACLSFHHPLKCSCKAAEN